MYFKGVSVNLSILYSVYWFHSAMALPFPRKAVLEKTGINRFDIQWLW